MRIFFFYIAIIIGDNNDPFSHKQRYITIMLKGKRIQNYNINSIFMWKLSISQSLVPSIKSIPSLRLEYLSNELCHIHLDSRALRVFTKTGKPLNMYLIPGETSTHVK